MGKSSVIKTLGNFVGNIVVHKILVRHTNKPESTEHLEREIEAYGGDALKVAREFNWNHQDKEEIREMALKNFKKNMIKHYGDVKFSVEEIELLIEETINELI